MAKGAILGQEQVKEESKNLYFVGSSTLQGGPIQVPNIIRENIPRAIVINLSDIKIDYNSTIIFSSLGNANLVIDNRYANIKELKSFQIITSIKAVEIIEENVLTCLIEQMWYDFGNNTFSNNYNKYRLYPSYISVQALNANNHSLRDKVTGKYEVYFQY